MRIAISGTHFIGKTTLIEDFIKQHPEYKSEAEPYDQLLEKTVMESALEPSLDGLLEELEYSIQRINESVKEKNIIFDRCPVDFIAYAMCTLDKDRVEINDSEVADLFPDIKSALNTLDLIIFLPISKENNIDYTEENPAYRIAADKNFKKLYRDEVCDVYPKYNHPRIIELTGDRISRLRKLESLCI